MASDESFRRMGIALAAVIFFLSFVFGVKQSFTHSVSMDSFDMAFVFMVAIFFGFIVLEIV